jgi:predicted metal-dependent phosphoesterase TrpH
MKIIDLHTHTKCSDGLLAPNELLLKAKEYNLSAISVTDHDTLLAYKDRKIFDFARNLNIELIIGIEFSTVSENGNKYHILGYDFDLENVELNKTIDELQNSRKEYTENVCKLLTDDGWYIDKVKLLKGGESITKAHISREVIHDNRNKEKLILDFGNMPSEGAFTEKYLIKGCKYFVKSAKKITPKEAIDVLHCAGGVAILAHPAFNIIQGEDFEVLTKSFLEMKIDGFECINLQYNKSKNDEEVDMVLKFENFCKKNSLLITGGSDYHHDKKELIGNFVDLGFKNILKYKVEYKILENLIKKNAK